MFRLVFALLFSRDCYVFYFFGQQEGYPMQAVGKGLFMLAQMPSGAGVLGTLSSLDRVEGGVTKRIRFVVKPLSATFHCACYCAIELAQLFCTGASNLNRIVKYVLCLLFFFYTYTVGFIKARDPLVKRKSCFQTSFAHLFTWCTITCFGYQCFNFHSTMCSALLLCMVLMSKCLCVYIS